MNWFQKEVTLDPKPRGFHVVTETVLEQVPEIERIDLGLLHVFIQHTSASLTLNENASPAVRGDMERHFNEMVPENQSYYEHTIEGSDDMPAHIKSALVGSSVSIPISNHRLNLGTWQGIYLCEFRNRGGSRKVVVTVMS